MHVSLEVRKAVQLVRQQHGDDAISFRMNVSQQCAIENEGLCVKEVIVDQNPDSYEFPMRPFTPQTYAGFPLKVDLRVPLDQIWVEDSKGKRLATISNLAIPKGFSAHD